MTKADGCCAIAESNVCSVSWRTFSFPGISDHDFSSGAGGVVEASGLNGFVMNATKSAS